jgi:membrane protease YdiL (CAAX protease family)
VSPWGIAVIAGMQVILNHFPPHDGPMPVYRTIGALAVAPVVEEAVRAVMLFSLQARWGTAIAVLATGLLNASVHAHPQLAMVQQLALTMVMLWTEGAMPANIVAHFAMNLMVVLYGGVAKG